MSTIRPAGYIGRVSGETVGRALISDTADDPTSCDKGSALSRTVPDICHGISSDKKESLDRVFEAMKKVGMHAILNDKKEKIYKSKQVEPLGTSLKRGYDLPPEDFRYGLKSERPECGIKDLVNPVDGIVDEGEKVMRLYRKTHNDYAPGERINREYTWAVNDDFVFGAPNAKGGAIEEAMKWNTHKDVANVHDKRWQDFRESNGHEVGRGKNSLQGLIPVPADFRFGKKCMTRVETAADAINRNYGSQIELKPDGNIGKSVPRNGIPLETQLN